MNVKFALVVSRFNQEVTDGLLRGALEFLRERNAAPGNEDIYFSPGAFEIPLLAKHLAQTGRYAGVICLGAVIKGETAHFEFISLAATLGIMQTMLMTSIPVTFGILTTYNQEQAHQRSGAAPENKGREAAAACLEAVETLQKISQANRDAIE